MKYIKTRMKHIISGNMSSYDGFIRVLNLRRVPADNHLPASPRRQNCSSRRMRLSVLGWVLKSELTMLMKP